MNLLLVEDEAGLLELLAEEIEDEIEGIRVLKACNGRKALEIFKANSVSLVITDCRMPIMDGVELAKKLQPYSVPIYLLTGHSQIYDENAILKSGVIQILRKPVEFEVLLEIIRKHLKVSA